MSAAASDGDDRVYSTLSKNMIVVPARSDAVIFLRHSSSSCGAVVRSVSLPSAMLVMSCPTSVAPVPLLGLSTSARGTSPGIAGRRMGVRIRPSVFVRLAASTKGKSTTMSRSASIAASRSSAVGSSETSGTIRPGVGR